MVASPSPSPSPSPLLAAFGIRGPVFSGSGSGRKRARLVSVTGKKGEPEPFSADAARNACAAGTGVSVLDVESGRFEFAFWKNITILAWSAQAEADAISRLERALERVVRAHSYGRSLVSIVAGGLPPPTEAARSGIAALMTRNSPSLACLGVVVQGAGFEASAQRSMHTGIRLSSTRAYEMGLFGTVEQLVGWLPPIHESRTRVKVDPEEFAAAIKLVEQGALARSTSPSVS